MDKTANRHKTLKQHTRELDSRCVTLEKEFTYVSQDLIVGERILIACSNIILMLKGFVIRKAYKLGGACSMYGDSRGVYMVLVRKPEGKTWKTQD
jgi:hypothetical protein